MVVVVVAVVLVEVVVVVLETVVVEVVVDVVVEVVVVVVVEVDLGVVVTTKDVLSGKSLVLLQNTGSHHDSELEVSALEDKGSDPRVGEGVLVEYPFVLLGVEDTNSSLSRLGMSLTVKS